MKDICSRWYIVEDMNGDGIFTISDVWEIIEFIWFYPVKAAFPFIEKYTKISTFLELNCTTGVSSGWVLLAILLWIILIVLLGLSLAMIEALLRRKPEF